jgi:hypothetical protein
VQLAVGGALDPCSQPRAAPALGMVSSVRSTASVSKKAKKRPQKKQWRNGPGKTIAGQVAQANAERGRERRTFGVAADDNSAAGLFVIDTENVGGELATTKKLLKRKAALRSEAILLPNTKIPTIGLSATPHAEMAKAIATGSKKPRARAQLSRPMQKVLGREVRRQANKVANRAANPRSGARGPLRDSYDLWGAAEGVVQVPDDAAATKERTARRVGRNRGVLKHRPSAGQLGTR